MRHTRNLADSSNLSADSSLNERYCASRTEVPYSPLHLSVWESFASPSNYKAIMPPFTGSPNTYDPHSFEGSLSGSCLCGSIHVTIADEELFTRPRGHLCHCANCRKVAGSYVSSNLIIEETKVSLDDKQNSLRRYMDNQTGSGKALSRYFCGICGK